MKEMTVLVQLAVRADDSIEIKKGTIAAYLQQTIVEDYDPDAGSYSVTGVNVVEIMEHDQ